MGLYDLDGVTEGRQNTSKSSTSTSKYGTHRVDKDAKFKDEEWLEQQKIEEDRSDQDIASQFDVDPETVRYWRKKFDIGTTYNTTKKLDEEVILNQFQIDIIEGDLLGDGSVVPNGNKSRYQAANKKKNYLEFIKNNLDQRLFTDNCWQNADGDKTVRLNTRATRQLQNIREKWYSDEKSLPDSFKINSTNMLLWYLGDGSLRNDNTPRLRICWTDEDSIKRAVQQLTEIIGDHISIHDNNNGCYRLLFKRECRDKFFRFIGSCPVDCYEYKWPPEYK